MMDPLSSVLTLLKPTTYITGGIAARGPWSVGIPEHRGIKCYSVVRGACWLVLESGGGGGGVDAGADEHRHLATGSCLLLPHGRPFRLASDPALPAVPVESLVGTRDARTGILSVGSGACPGDESGGAADAETLILGSHFALGGDTHFLLDALPPVVMLQTPAQQEALRWGVERMVRELRAPQPGGALIAQQVAYTMLVEALRLYLAEAPRQGAGWLRALAEPGLGAALSAMHAEPARAWTLAALARTAGMSRTAFAQAFKSVVGRAPMEYLTHWRMTLATERLRDGRETLFDIAPAVGYRSESAFGAAFKRHWGVSPRHYRQQGS